MSDELATQPDWDQTLDFNELASRRSRLVCWSVAGAILSLLAVLLVGTTLRGSVISGWFAVLIAGVFGTFIGLAQAPLLGWTIARKKSWLALPLVNLGAVAISCVVMQSHNLALAIVAFTFSVPALALLAMLLPNERLGRRNRCYSCGYDLVASTSNVCPDCGAPNLAPTMPQPAATDHEPARQAEQ